MKFLRNVFSQLLQYPSAILGLLFIFVFCLLAALAPLFMPYDEALEHWRGTESVVGGNPRNAKPIWVNWFRSEKLPRTINVTNDANNTTREQLSDELWETVTTYEIDFTADKLPSELIINFNAVFDEKPPFVEMEWIKPNGDVIDAGQISPGSNQQFRFTQDEKLMRRLDAPTAEQAFFSDPDNIDKPLKGTHQLVITALHFEEGSELNSDFTPY